MARIRSIHPEFFTDEAVMEMTPWCQLLLIGIWTQCDDAGVFEWKPIVLKARILPAADVKVVELMDEAVAAKAIVKFTIDGVNYGVVRNFCKFQKPKKPALKHPRTPEMESVARYSAPDTSRHFPTMSEAMGDEYPTSAEPVPHQFPTASPPVGKNELRGEERERREGGEELKNLNASSATSARVSEQARSIIEEFDSALVETFGNELARICPASSDPVYATRWAEQGLTPLVLGAVFRTAQRSRADRGAKPIGSLAYLDKRVAELVTTTPSGAVEIRLPPGAELERRVAAFTDAVQAAKATGAPPPRSAAYGIRYDLDAQEFRLAAEPRPEIPELRPVSAGGGQGPPLAA